MTTQPTPRAEPIQRTTRAGLTEIIRLNLQDARDWQDHTSACIDRGDLPNAVYAARAAEKFLRESEDDLITLLAWPEDEEEDK